ncbi:MAG: hypothetical protein JW827_02945 [Spirochaetes bacterium]|nr:hypothetical protein [Spirochaetota bacterium]
MAVSRKALKVSTGDAVGILEKVCGALAGKNVNIEAIAAYGQEGKAFFYLITSDNDLAEEAISELGYNMEEREMVVMELPDEVGQLKIVAEKVAKAGINLTYIFGSISRDSKSAMIIMNSDNNKKLLEIL